MNPGRIARRRPRWDEQQFAVSLDQVQRGEFGFGADNLRPEHLQWLGEVLGPLLPMTWGGVKGLRRGNGRPLHSDCNYDDSTPALQQLVEGLQYDDGLQDLVKYRLFKFRVTERARLWGFLDDGVFFPLWWDPEHRL